MNQFASTSLGSGTMDPKNATSFENTAKTLNYQIDARAAFGPLIDRSKNVGIL